MTTETDEGMDLVAVFKERFAAPERTQARMKAEKRAGMTPAQRARKGPTKVQINFRATLETKALLKALADHLDKTEGDVVTAALEALARATKGFGSKP